MDILYIIQSKYVVRGVDRGERLPVLWIISPYIFYDDGKILAFISPKWWPNNPGSVIVIPHEHVTPLFSPA